MTFNVALSLFFVLAVFVVYLFDVAAVIRGSPDDSVSKVLLTWSQRFPILPLCVGIVIGHLFWPNH